MFVSIGLRFKVEVEALNMAESVGNYARHRTAPVVVVEYEDGKVRSYRITMAPAVSGQSIAYGYMAALVKLALERGLPLSNQAKEYEKIGGFFKRADDANLSYDDRVKTCVVEDITGFMVAQGVSGQRGVMLRRTSPVMFSYLVPDGTSARGVVMPQLHVRYNLLNPEQQIPFQVEAGTAIYTHGVAIDVERIGRLQDGYVQDRKARVELAFDALKFLYGGLLFGAKKARYLPIFEPLGGVAAVSEKPFVVTPPRFRDYVQENVKRAERHISKVSIYCFDNEGITTCGASSTKTQNLEELIDKVKEEVLKTLK
jgi:CRISPR-associated protein Csa2